MIDNIYSAKHILIYAENISLSSEAIAKQVLIKEMSFEIIKGEFVIISGLKGITKNSLIDLISCRKKPVEGRYLFDYEEIYSLSYKNISSLISKKIGFLFSQDNLLDYYDIRKNILLPISHMNISHNEKDRRLFDIINMLNLKDISNKRVNELSSVERYKIAIARSIINDPILILVHEPLFECDESEINDIFYTLKKINDLGITIIMFASNKIEDYSDIRNIVFYNGRIVV